jgi:hypothetical protein
MQIWKDIPEYNGIYKISNTGEVKSHSDKGIRILKPDLAKGYLRVTLSKNNSQKRFMIHRLVAESFLPKINNKKYVNHIDGNKLNNDISNLEWCTASENEKHSYNKLGKIPPCAKKCIDKSTGIIYTSVTKAANAINIKPGTLLAKLNGQIRNNTNIIAI